MPPERLHLVRSGLVLREYARNLVAGFDDGLWRGHNGKFGVRELAQWWPLVDLTTPPY